MGPGKLTRTGYHGAKMVLVTVVVPGGVMYCELERC